ncbi:LHX1 protein, partial [Ciccaba nigrolineata]|nr:LHX1 protein [Ciccaba nigrolineata]
MVHCAGCKRPILDRFLLNVLDRAWHVKCVQCCECKCNLTEKCFSREGKLYCKNDFFRCPPRGAPSEPGRAPLPQSCLETIDRRSGRGGAGRARCCGAGGDTFPAGLSAAPSAALCGPSASRQTEPRPLWRAATGPPAPPAPPPGGWWGGEEATGPGPQWRRDKFLCSYCPGNLGEDRPGCGRPRRSGARGAAGAGAGPGSAAPPGQLITEKNFCLMFIRASLISVNYDFFPQGPPSSQAQTPVDLPFVPSSGPSGTPLGAMDHPLPGHHPSSEAQRFTDIMSHPPGDSPSPEPNLPGSLHSMSAEVFGPSPPFSSISVNGGANYGNHLSHPPEMNEAAVW